MYVCMYTRMHVGMYGKVCIFFLKTCRLLVVMSIYSGCKLCMHCLEQNGLNCTVNLCYALSQRSKDPAYHVMVHLIL